MWRERETEEGEGVTRRERWRGGIKEGKRQSIRASERWWSENKAWLLAGEEATTPRSKLVAEALTPETARWCVSVGAQTLIYFSGVSIKVPSPTNSTGHPQIRYLFVSRFNTNRVLPGTQLSARLFFFFFFFFSYCALRRSIFVKFFVVASSVVTIETVLGCHQLLLLFKLC